MVGVFNILLMVFLAICCLVSMIGIPVIPVYWLAVFFGAPQRVSKAQKKLDDTLMQEETLVSQGNYKLKNYCDFMRAFWWLYHARFSVERFT